MSKAEKQRLIFESTLVPDPQLRTNWMKALAGAFLVSALLIPTVLWATTNWMGLAPLKDEATNSGASLPEFTSALSFRNDSAAQEVLAQGSPFFTEQIELAEWDPSDDFSSTQAELHEALAEAELGLSMELLELPVRHQSGADEQWPFARLEVEEIEPIPLSPPRQAAPLEPTIATLFLQIEGTNLQKIWPTKQARSFEIPQGLELPTWPGVSMKVGVVGESGLVEFCAPLDDAVAIEKSRALTRWVKQLKFEKTPKHLVWGEVRIWQKQIKVPNSKAQADTVEKTQ